MRFKPVHPFVMFSKDSKKKNSKMHPHIIVGVKDDKYVSMGVTHAKKVRGQKTVSLPDNIEKSYLITTPYVRERSKYKPVQYKDNYHVSSRDHLIAEKHARKTKKYNK